MDDRRSVLQRMGSGLIAAIPLNTVVQETPTEDSDSESNITFSSGHGIELSYERTQEMVRETPRTYFSVTNTTSERIHGVPLETVHEENVSPRSRWEYIFDFASGETRTYFLRDHHIQKVQPLPYQWTEDQMPFPPDADTEGTFVERPPRELGPAWYYEYSNPTSIPTSDIRNISARPAPNMPDRFTGHIDEVSLSVEDGSLRSDWGILGSIGDPVPGHWSLWGEATVQSLQKEETFTFAPERPPSISFSDIGFTVEDTGSDLIISTIDGQIENDPEVPVPGGEILVIARDPVFVDSVSSYGDYPCDQYAEFGSVTDDQECRERKVSASTVDFKPEYQKIQRNPDFTVEIERNVALPLPESTQVTLIFKAGYSILAATTIDLQTYL